MSVNPRSSFRSASRICSVLACAAIGGCATVQPPPHSKAVPPPYPSPLFHSGQKLVGYTSTFLEVDSLPIDGKKTADGNGKKAADSSVALRCGYTTKPFSDISDFLDGVIFSDMPTSLRGYGEYMFKSKDRTTDYVKLGKFEVVIKDLPKVHGNEVRTTDVDVVVGHKIFTGSCAIGQHGSVVYAALCDRFPRTVSDREIKKAEAIGELIEGTCPSVMPLFTARTGFEPWFYREGAQQKRLEAYETIAKTISGQDPKLIFPPLEYELFPEWRPLILFSMGHALNGPQ